MFATIDALATESWAPRKTLCERARLDESLLPSDTSGCRDVGRQIHLRPVAYCTSGLRFERPVDGLTASLSEELICATKGT